MKNDKLNYSEAIVEIVLFETDDVIATSGGGDGIVVPDENFDD